MRLCFWSVGDGECAFILQALVDSFRGVGMEGDFHVFSDRKIEGAITHLVAPFDKRGFFFKFAFLQSQLVLMDYDYFIYIDSDCLFVRKPPDLLSLVASSPIHFSLETVIAGDVLQKNWWNCPLSEYVGMMRECGVTSKEIYTLNGGFFILRREAIETACGLAQDFFEYAQARGHIFPDEPLWGYAMHMLCEDPKKHLLSDHWDVWASDWKGEFAKSLPEGKPWTFEDYMTGKQHVVNPAIVHALRSKQLLIAKGSSHAWPSLS